MKRNTAIGIGIAIALVAIVSLFFLAVYNQGQKPTNPDSGSTVSPPTPTGKHLQMNLNESIGLKEENP